MISQYRMFASVCLILTLSVTNYLMTNGHVQTEDGISHDEDTTRPEITSLQGKLRGVNMLTRFNRTVYGFKGIPFAEPPLGDLRFKAPVSAGSWTGTFDASKDSKLCPQIGTTSGMVEGDEDCLYLHVYTPKLPENNSTLLPVMVFVFGGGFIMGNSNSAAYGPNFLLDKDVILVVPSYRLGVLGFLTTGDEASPGNYGMKDIVLALEWIRDNIPYFGGDPHRVTLFGSSSGAMSVSLLALSNSTNGLFHQFITQSGTAFGMELSLPKDIFVDHTTRLGEYLGCPTNTSTLLVECLRGMSTEKLVDTKMVFYQNEWIPTVTWLPTTEPDIEGALLTETPAELFAAGKIRDIPSIVVFDRDEGLLHTQKFYGNPELFEDFLDDIDDALPHLLGYIDSTYNTTAFNAALKSYYLNDLSADRRELLTNTTELIGDGLFYYPGYMELQQRLIHTKSPVYFGSFEYRGVFGNTYELTRGSTDQTGIAHGDELIYLFQNFLHRYGPPNFKYSEEDWSMVGIMVELWTSFATNGIPTIGDSDDTFIWDRYSSLNNYLRIGNGINDTAIEMKYNIRKERMNFWKGLSMRMSNNHKSHYNH